MRTIEELQKGRQSGFIIGKPSDEDIDQIEKSYMYGQPLSWLGSYNSKQEADECTNWWNTHHPLKDYAVISTISHGNYYEVKFKFN